MSTNEEMARAVPFRESTGAKNDQYFLRPEVAKQLASWVKHNIQKCGLTVTRFEDPCAGSGETTCYFPGADAFDLDPKPNEYGITVIQRDFFNHEQGHETGLMLLMNVPYGYNSNAAISFFNHGAKFADYLAVVVPKTWETGRGTFNHRLHRNFHKIAETHLPHKSFYLPSQHNKPHDVRSVAQIWIRKDELRQDHQRVLTSEYFEAARNQGRHYIRIPDVAIRRVGTNAGQIKKDDFNKLTQEGWWYIFVKNNKPRVIQAIENVNWYQYGHVMAQRSISKTELITAIEGELHSSDDA